MFRIASPARRDSPTRRHGLSAVQGAQPPSREPTSLSALSRSITPRGLISSPPNRQSQRHAAQIQTGMVLHRTGSGSLESAQASARANRRETVRRRLVETSRVPVSPAADSSPARVRTLHDSLDSRIERDAARTGAKSAPVLQLSSNGIVRGNVAPFAAVAPPRLDVQAVNHSALADQGEGSRLEIQAAVLRCVFLLRLAID